MLWWVETKFSVKNWSIAIISALVLMLIPNAVASWLLNLLSEEWQFPCYIFPLYFTYSYIHC